VYLYHLWIKEYADVSWIGFLILFIISILPIVIAKFREKSVFYHQAYNLFFNLVVPVFFSGTSYSLTGNGSFRTAFFIAFGIGYSILIFRKKRKDLFEILISAISLIAYLSLFIFIVIGQMDNFKL